MGERDIADPRRISIARRGWLPPALLLLGLALLVAARPTPTPATPRSVAHYLHAESLALDFDSRFDERDLGRLRQLPQTGDLRVLLSRGEGGATVYPGAGPEAALLAPFVRSGGLNGAVLGTALMLVCAMGMAAGTMRKRLHAPWGLLLLSLFGSVVIRYVLEPRPEALFLAAVLAGFSLAYRGEASDLVEMPEIYDQAYRQGGKRFALRWVAVGLLLGVVAIAHPLFLLLFVPAGLAAPEISRRRAWLWMGAGAGLLLLVSILMVGGPGALPWFQETAVVGAGESLAETAFEKGAGNVVLSPLESASPMFHPRLGLWSLLFVAVGQTIGALPYCIPLLMLLALWEPRSGRSPLVVTAAVMVVVSVLVWPFDYAGEPAALGNALLLPLFGALWLLPTRPVRPAWLVAFAVVAGVFLYPVWLQALGLRVADGPVMDSVSPAAVRFLPLESTQRVDEEVLIRSGDLRVRLIGGAVSQRGGQMMLGGRQWGDLLVISPRPLDALWLEFDGQAGSDLEVMGAELGNTMFRADGKVAFEILLTQSARRHPMWWSREDHSLYDLHLRLPKAPPYLVGFSITADGSTGF